MYFISTYLMCIEFCHPAGFLFLSLNNPVTLSLFLESNH
jgi:hypothetical protein